MLNRLHLQGRFTRDLELKQTTSGVEVVNFCLAWSEKYKDKETTLFINCVAYRSMAIHIANFFTKGDQVLVEGKLTSRSYDDKEGNKRHVTELLVDKVHFVGNKKKNDDLTERGEPAGSDEFEDVDSFGDLPF